MEFRIDQLPAQETKSHANVQMDDGVCWGELTDLAGHRIDDEGFFARELDGSGEEA